MPRLHFSCRVQIPYEDPVYSDLELPLGYFSLLCFFFMSFLILSLYFQDLSQLSCHPA